MAFPASVRKAPAAPKKLSGVETTETKTAISLRSGSVRAVFDKSTGLLTEFGAGVNLIQRGPQLNVWRAAIDNDCMKLFLTKREKWFTAKKPLPNWLNFKLNEVKHSVASVRLIRSKDALPIVEIVHQVSGREQWKDFQHIHRYTLTPAGELHVENTVKIGPDLNDLPRIGVSLILTPGLEQLEWFGRGPWENYPDRKASAMLGRYKSTVAEQYVPYVMPQENGHKTDTRWLTLTGADGHGLQVHGEPVLEFSASHFTDNDLYAAFHTCELKPRPEVTLNLDTVVRGLGTAACGPDTLEQYKIQGKEYKFDYRLILQRKVAAGQAE